MSGVALRARPIAMALAPLTLWVLASCGGSSGGTAVEQTAAPEPLLVCSDIPYEPFEFSDQGQLAGFDVDLVDAVADRLGRTATFVPTPLDQFTTALDAGTCELVASALPIPDPTSTTLLFSDPYLDVAPVLLVRAGDAQRLPTTAATGGTTVGVVTDSPSADFAAGNLPADAVVRPFATADDAVAALAAGEIDAVVTDAPIAEHAELSDPSLVVTEHGPITTGYGLATNAARGALLDQVNAALGEIRGDGTYDSLTRTWFGS
jgi:polar amino acid transport system substrate-binding protein